MSLKKLIIVGDGNCGKTCILQRFCNKVTPGTYEPTVFDNFAATIKVRQKNRDITIWDTSGQEDWASIRQLTYTDVDLVLVTFDVSNPDSLANVRETWEPEVRTYCRRTPIILVGNKKDLRQCGLGRIQEEEAMRVAEEIEAVAFMECSALTGEGVDEIFKKAAKIIFSLQCTIL